MFSNRWESSDDVRLVPAMEGAVAQNMLIANKWWMSMSELAVRNSHTLEVFKPNPHLAAESHPAATRSRNHCYLTVVRKTAWQTNRFHWVSTCLISLFSLCIPVRSVLVAPVWPNSWMEIAGLEAVDWIGRTDAQRQKHAVETKKTSILQISELLATFPATQCRGEEGEI